MKISVSGTETNQEIRELPDKGKHYAFIENKSQGFPARGKFVQNGHLVCFDDATIRDRWCSIKGDKSYPVRTESGLPEGWSFADALHVQPQKDAPWILTDADGRTGSWDHLEAHDISLVEEIYFALPKSKVRGGVKGDRRGVQLGAEDDEVLFIRWLYTKGTGPWVLISEVQKSQSPRDLYEVFFSQCYREISRKKF